MSAASAVVAITASRTAEDGRHIRPNSGPLLARMSRPMILAVDVDSEIEECGLANLLILTDFRSGMPMLRAAGVAAPMMLEEAPALLVAVLTSDARSQRTIRLLDWLDARGATRPPIIACASGGPAQALRELGTLVRNLGAADSTRRAETASEAARLQAMNSDLCYQFQLAEAAMHRRGAAMQRLAFTNDPAGGSAQELVLTETSGAIAQILPVSSSGVSAVGIHVATPSEDTTELIATLVGLEDEKAYAEWHLPSSVLTQGWNLLGLPRTPSGPARTLELRLACKGGDGRLPSISLSTPQPVAPYQVRSMVTGQPAMNNSLALRMWQTVPGTAPRHEPAVHQPVQAAARKGGYRELPLASAMLSQVEHANPQDTQFAFPAVVAPPGEDSVLCHPPSHGVTIGCLRMAVPSAALKVSASAFVGSEKSKAIDFAIIVAADAARAGEISRGGTVLGRGEGFSGWSRVAQQEVRRLSAFRDNSDEGAQTLFIATRMSAPGDNSHAWARFKDFSVMVQA